jgi:anti-anti-sigma factor
VSDQSSELFVIDVSHPSPGLYVVALVGEMDIANTAAFASRIAGLGATGAYRVVIDLSALTFLDSSGINALVSAAKALEADGGEVTLAAPTAHIRQVFEIVNLAEVVAIEPSLDVALRQGGANGHIGDPSLEA